MALSLILLVLFAPVSALVNAQLYAKLWHVTLGVQFGDGPTSLSWYGISLFVSIAFSLGTLHLSKKPDPQRKITVVDTAGKLLEHALIGWGLIGFMIFAAMFARLVLGW